MNAHSYPYPFLINILYYVMKKIIIILILTLFLNGCIPTFTVYTGTEWKVNISILHDIDILTLIKTGKIYDKQNNK